MAPVFRCGFLAVLLGGAACRPLPSNPPGPPPDAGSPGERPEAGDARAGAVETSPLPPASDTRSTSDQEDARAMADGPAPVADAPPPAADAAVPVVDASPGDPAAEAALNPINAAFGCPSDPALLACYTFDEGPATSILDGSGLGHHGTTNAPRTAGVHGMALKFADDKSVAQVRSTPALTLAGSNATIEAWVRPTMFPAENQLDHLLVKMNAAHDRGYAFGVSKGRFGGYNASSGQLAGSLPLHTWSHIAVVWSAGGLSLYQDGVRVGSFGRLDLTPSDDPLFVGNINPANAELSASYTAYFGDLDVLRIYARPRTPEEICADANRSFRTGGCF